jgi:hypothetical protein
VTGVAPNYRIHGWLYGHEGMKDRYLAGHGGREKAYFVPKRDLRPISNGDRS